MYQKIMVPLDGSKLAECALPHATQIAKGCGNGEIILVSVTERIAGKTQAPEVREIFGADDEIGGPEVNPETYLTFGKMQQQAERYLSKIARGLEGEGIKVRTEVLVGKPAEEIVNFAEHNDVEAIVMSSHGRSGPSRWVHGSVANKVLRAICVPVLMVRAPGCVIGI
jgi:nucleotide-binding universal stress UspA family protein